MQQWNPPTSVTIAPGAIENLWPLSSSSHPEIRNIEKTLIANHRPVAVGIPGYVLPMDLDARLFLNYPAQSTALTVEPQGAITVREEKPTGTDGRLTRCGERTGAARGSRLLTTNDSKQSISYYVIKPAVAGRG